MSVLDFERLHERGAALGVWIDAGCSVDRLAALDRAVRRGRVTDWPGRDPGPEVRNGIPDLDLPDADPQAWRYASWWPGSEGTGHGG
jgi:hypothetical protein